MSDLELGMVQLRAQISNMLETVRVASVTPLPSCVSHALLRHLVLDIILTVSIFAAAVHHVIVARYCLYSLVTCSALSMIHPFVRSSRKPARSFAKSLL